MTTPEERAIESRMEPENSELSAARQLLGTLDLDHVLPPHLFDVLAEAIAVTTRSAVTQERDRWIFHLDAALRDEFDTSRSDVNHHWRTRIREIVGPRIEAAVAAEREACAAIAERETMNPPHDTWGACAETIAAAIRARGGA